MTERQEKIFNKIIKEYVKTARPVGSVILEEKYNFSLCPATIRNEMKELTNMGYLYQPHTSSGRVPTSKGYRYFVNNILNEKEYKDREISQEKKYLNKKEESFEKTIKNIEEKIREIALGSSGLAFAYFFEKDLFLVEGWNIVLKNPEFEEKNFLTEFISHFDLLEEKIKEDLKEINNFQISIGKENSFINSDNLSLIISKNKDSNTYFGIFGPSRMEYNKNIKLILDINNF